MLAYRSFSVALPESPHPPRPADPGRAVHVFSKPGDLRTTESTDHCDSSVSRPDCVGEL